MTILNFSALKKFSAILFLLVFNISCEKKCLDSEKKEGSWPSQKCVSLQSESVPTDPVPPQEPSPSIPEIQAWSFIDGDGTNGLNKEVSKNADSPTAVVFALQHRQGFTNYAGLQHCTR